jgi:hypothetical protein
MRHDLPLPLCAINIVNEVIKFEFENEVFMKILNENDGISAN